MASISAIGTKLRKRVSAVRFRHLTARQRGELDWWQGHLARLVDWYKGRKAGVSYIDNKVITDTVRVTGFSVRENAVRTWLNVDAAYYPTALRIARGYFSGLRICDVGCGPIPAVLAFSDCEIWGVDQLVEGYKAIGYPLERYAERMHYLAASAEHIPVADQYFDAVISVNALDHVDDFPSAAAEIRRILRPHGTLRLQVQYHAPTQLEPQVLNDELVLEHFGSLGISKVYETPATAVNRECHVQDHKITVWSTPDRSQAQ